MKTTDRVDFLLKFADDALYQAQSALAATPRSPPAHPRRRLYPNQISRKT